MRVIVFGGHGKVASLVEPLLVARGDEVTAVIRHADQEGEVRATGATPLVLDVETASPEEVRSAVDGHDAVVWSAGAGGGSPARTYAVDRDAAIGTMDAAEAAGARRYVMVSWIGSSPDHGIDPANPFYAYAAAKLAADDHLRGTTLNWTILGPATLTLDPPTGRIEIDPDDQSEVPRADVAAVVVAALDDDRTIGRFVRFGGGSTPIADALAG